MRSEHIVTLIHELLEDDRTAQEAADALREAEARFQVASRRYAALRDYVYECGLQPYKEPIGGPDGECVSHPADFPSGGHLRFTHLMAGDAAARALAERSEPTTLEGLVTVLSAGGLPGVSLRSIHAALMNKKGVRKTADDPPRFHLCPPNEESQPQGWKEPA